MVAALIPATPAPFASGAAEVLAPRSVPAKPEIEQGKVHERDEGGSGEDEELLAGGGGEEEEELLAGAGGDLEEGLLAGVLGLLALLVQKCKRCLRRRRCVQAAREV